MIAKFLKCVSVISLVFLSSCKWGCHNCGHDHGSKKHVTVQHKNSSSVIHIKNDTQFEEAVLQEKAPVIVKFHAEWCGACKDMQPIYEELAHDADLASTKFTMIDVDEAGDIAKQYGIRGIPAFLFFEDGKETSQEDRIEGFVSKDELKTKIQTTFTK